VPAHCRLQLARSLAQHGATGDDEFTVTPENIHAFRDTLGTLGQCRLTAPNHFKATVVELRTR
jgi:hypothetical protein